MGEKSNISWTNSSWNPVTGCSKVSDGCKFCYAETLSLRMGWSEKPWAAAYAAENVKLHPDRLDMPLRWKKPRMVFVNSMSDLFHEIVPDSFISQVWNIMMRCPQHTFQVLTKRPERMRRWVKWWTGQPCGDPQSPSHIWLGTSIENQRAADERIPHLLATPAAVRFLSCEPLLGPLNLDAYLWETSYGDPELGSPVESDPADRLHWIICGGESGTHLGHPDQEDRWMDPAWARDLRDQCVTAGVPFFMKQHSGRRPGMQPYIIEADHRHTEWHQFPACVQDERALPYRGR